MAVAGLLQACAHHRPACDRSLSTQVAGFVGSSCPDLLLQALRARFDEQSTPRNLTLIYVASAADGNAAGLNRLAARGLVSKLIYAWTGSAPQLARMVREGHVQAWNLPLGIGKF